jgi:hypothetical protein
MGNHGRNTVAMLLFLAITAAPQVGDTKDKARWVHARTADEVVNAFVSANTSGVPTVIRLAPGDYTFSSSFDSGRGATTLPPVSTTIILMGRRAEKTRFFGASEARIFTVLSAGRLFVSELTLIGGASFCVEDACPTPGGGAAANFGGVLSFEHCVLEGNRTHSAEGNTYLLGGAILSGQGHLRLEHTIVTGNYARGRGGGLAIIDGTATISNSIVSNNAVVPGGPSNFGVSEGGGIFVSGAHVRISRTTIAGNVAGSSNTEWFGSGGGIHNYLGRISIRNSAITENAAIPIGSGGGINNFGDITIENTTVGGNTIGTIGGGIYNEGRLTLQGVSIVRNDVVGGGRMGGIGGPGFPESCQIDNPAGCIAGGGGLWNQPPGKVVIATTLISNNNHGAVPNDCEGVLASKGHNAIGRSSAGCELQSIVQPKPTYDLFDLDARIGELQDSGDPGNTHYPLLEDSPLIDAAGRISRTCDERDQIKQRRRDGDNDGKVRCDVGAIEFQPRIRTAASE